MTIEEMKQRKKELGLTNRQVADRSGIPLGTVQKIFSGATAAPREETLIALERLLRPQYRPAVRTGEIIAEPSVFDHGRVPYTLDDYFALPDDVRMELIDGVFYDMAAPTTVHQAIAGCLYKKLMDHVFEHQGPCYPLISPVDVQLDSDDYTMIQPDVVVLCDRSKLQQNRVIGAPDLVIEVLSPSTRKKDMQEKLYKYARAGVREYWMIDPEKLTVVQYDLEQMDFPTVYGPEDSVPVLIWDGACRIDLKELDRATAFVREAVGSE